MGQIINVKSTERALARFKDTDEGGSIGFTLNFIGFKCDPDDMELYEKGDFRVTWDWNSDTKKGSWILFLKRREDKTWRYDTKDLEEVLRYLRPFAIEPLEFFDNRGLPLEYRPYEYFVEHFRKLHS